MSLNFKHPPEPMDKGSFGVDGIYGYPTSSTGGLKYTTIGLVGSSLTDTMILIGEHARDNYDLKNTRVSLKEITDQKDCDGSEKLFIFVVTGDLTLPHNSELSFINWSATTLLQTTPVIVSPDPSDPDNSILHLVCYRYYAEDNVSYVEDCQIVPVEREIPGAELSSSCVYAAESVSELSALQQLWLTTVNNDEFLGYPPGTLLVTNFSFEPLAATIDNMDRHPAKLYRINISLQVNLLTWGRWIWYVNPDTGQIPEDANVISVQPLGVKFIVPFSVVDFDDLLSIGSEFTSGS